MKSRLKLLIIAGARPNFMKIAPLIKAIDAHNDFQKTQVQSPVSYRLVHTGQHYDEKMSKVFFSELGIPEPDFNLEVGSGSHAVQTANIMLKFEPVLLAEKPDWVVVVGDVNSTVACTLVASKLGVRVAHVEAGLRSFDRSMPEEINRLVTDALADLLLTPSEDANDNLRREGVPEEKIKLVGNIMIDALVDNLPAARRSGILKTIGVAPGAYAYVTLHRPANVDCREALVAIISELKTLAAQMPVVFPMHPRTRKQISDFEIAVDDVAGFKIVEPVGYYDSLCLTENARVVVTDSGGLQEESTYFQTPCLTLRPNTERPVTITIGSNRLTNQASLRADLAEVLEKGSTGAQIPPLWDGCTADRVLNRLVQSP